ncbi:MAG: aminotransferase class I/II [Planctomycetaceae bacterium]|nr:aminotransferase class I/II [Planctomycetaceae bacterium]MBT4188866.1 aminotransferase class I/II-fold pyridoxal phosphate-dependent enzyme [Gemmatimonadales bacterium]MBT7692560.1 aminotransferase class I/II-fold pyridoxal phosphate-dependent enzyme [Gemmatimonadales bacterium]
MSPDTDPKESFAFSHRARDLRRSTIRVLFDAADQNPDAIRLEVGEPSFTTPQHIIDAASSAAAAGYTHYGPNGGLTSLRELLVDKIQKVNGFKPAFDQVVVTPGAMNGLYSIYAALLNPGDEVLLPTPGFPNMDETVRLLGGRPVFYELERHNGYLPDPDRIASLVTPRTKALFLNTPNNPTGAVIPPERIEAILSVTSERGVWVISDEVYDQLILDDGLPYLSPGSVDTSMPIISVYSFSKVYSMTGWRVGYLVAPPALAQILRTLQEPQVSCPSTISQKAAEAALTGPREPIEAMRSAYVRNRDSAWTRLLELGLEGFRTQGTFYMLVDIAKSGLAPLDFSLRLLEEGGVAVAPGEVFGPGGDEVVRISLANDRENIELGLDALSSFIEKAQSQTS